MNKVCLIGNICNDLELKTTQSGKSVCSFNLAVRRPFAKDTTDFFAVVVWNRYAELLTRLCEKGYKIGVAGYLSTRKYQDKEGKDRTFHEIVADELDFFQIKTVGVPTSKPEIAEREPADDDGFKPVDDPLLPFADDCPF